MIHQLKIERNYLKRLLSGEKKAEIRLNDRDYQLYDILKFYNYAKPVKPGDEDYWLYFRITHIHSGLGMDTGGCGYVCMSVQHIDPAQAAKEQS